MTTEASMTDAAIGRFYTKAAIGDVLIESIRSRPKRVIDLGSGGGSLASAALRKWRPSEIITVDIDRNAQTKLMRGRNHVHVVADVLDFDLPQLLPSRALFDAAICNPPYIMPAWKPGFQTILEDAGLSAVLHGSPLLGADVLFLAQNLRLTKAGGSIGLIVPDGIVTGRRLCRLRQELMSAHSIESVIQLPRGCFKSTDAQAFIMVLTKSRKQIPMIALRRLDSAGALSEPVLVDPDRATERCDYAYHAVPRSPAKGTFTLKDAGAEITRGSMHSGEAKRSGQSYLHTTHLPCTGPRRLRFAVEQPRLSCGSLTTAAAGDILVARIGRKLHLQVAWVAAGKIAITDCIFRVRVPKPWRARVFRAMTSRHGAAALKAAARGVGARLVTKDDLLRMELQSS
jgi:type I restriction enzyme M protein